MTKSITLVVARRTIADLREEIKYLSIQLVQALKDIEELQANENAAQQTIENCHEYEQGKKP